MWSLYDGLSLLVSTHPHDQLPSWRVQDDNDVDDDSALEVQDNDDDANSVVGAINFASLGSVEIGIIVSNSGPVVLFVVGGGSSTLPQDHRPSSRVTGGGRLVDVGSIPVVEVNNPDDVDELFADCSATVLDWSPTRPQIGQVSSGRA